MAWEQPRPSASRTDLRSGLEKGPAGRSRSARAKACRMAGQFLLQPAQGLDIVDIVPFRKQCRGKADLASAFACSTGDGFRPPCDAREQLLVRMLQSDEIVTAVARRSKHHAVTRCAQSF